MRLQFAGKAFVISSLLAAASLLVLGARRHKSEQPRHRVDLAQWNVLERPDWSRLDDVRMIRAASGLAGKALPLYDRDAAEIVRVALERTPRAKRVLSIHRMPPNRVELVLEMRRPVAAIALSDGRFVEVDAEGIVLSDPSMLRPVREDVPLRVVRGAVAATPRAGATCSADVQAGLRLCTLLDGYRDGLGALVLRTFDEIDVTNHGGRVDPAASEILLRAAPIASDAGAAAPPIAPAADRDALRPLQCAVEWGRLGEEFGEPSFAVKASRLASAVRIFGDFEGIARVRVAFDELSVVPVAGTDGSWIRELSQRDVSRSGRAEQNTGR